MRIDPQPPDSWMDLQWKVARILSECGLTARVETTVQTARGCVELDVYAEDAAQTPPAVCICECKRWSTAVSKDVVHAFRTVVADLGASWGFLISSAGFQSGAYDAATYSNIRLMTWDQFEATWIERWTEQYLRPIIFNAHERLSDYTEPLIGCAMMRRADGLPPNKRQKFIDLRNDPSKALPAAIALHLGAPWHSLLGNASFDLPLRNSDLPWATHVPAGLSKTDSLREFGDLLCQWIADVTAEFDTLFGETSQAISN